MKANLDTSQIGAAYGAALRRMAALTDLDQRQILRAEAGSILKTWAGRTKVATAQATEIRGRARALRSITDQGRASATSGFLTINSGRRSNNPGQMWYRTRRGKFQAAGMMNVKSGGAWRWSWIHFPNDDWSAMQAAAAKASAALVAMIPAARRSAGLARQSVVQIADALNIDLLQVPGGGVSAAGLLKARAALASTGSAYYNGTARSAGTDIKPYIDLFNGLPYALRIGMDRTLLGVVAGRTKFFEQSYAKGAFDSLQKTARAYPGLFTVTTTAA